MKPQLSSLIAACALSASVSGVQAGSAGAEAEAKRTHARETESPTALDRYATSPDGAFAWKEKGRSLEDGIVSVLLEVTSQTWLGEGDVSHPTWTHWVRVARPATPDFTDTALLVISGGVRRENAPEAHDGLLARLARATGSVVVLLQQVPNQPLVLNGDGEQRYEDDLIAESWEIAMETEDLTWIAQLPMVKSATATMTAVQEFLEQEPGFEKAPERFVVTGSSKRGWTTWLTAAVDARVAAIVPIVIDTLNLPAVMAHHWGAYGFWSESIEDYTQRGFAEILDSEKSKPLRRIVDPFLYRDRLTMPKFLINAAGDQYFLPDTTRYYLDELMGVTRLRVVPNTDHSMANKMIDVATSATAFFRAVAKNIEMPAPAWSFDINEETGKATLHVRSDAAPSSITAWTAMNPEARDFRVKSIGYAWESTELKPGEDGSYRYTIDIPDKGFRAVLAEVQYDVDGLDVPMTFSTEVFIVPDVLPHKDKPME